MCQYSLNPYLTDKPAWNQKECPAFYNNDILKFHQSIKGYQPTPLIELPALSKKLGVKEIYVKDESHRFGLKAFKAMGASYAIYRFIKQTWEKEFGVQFEICSLYHKPQMLKKLGLRPFCTATDGNHGRAVAWFARLINQKAVIYVPETTVAARITNIEKEGAQVVVVAGDYDQAVRRAASDAQRNGWTVISDTSYAGYTEIPTLIMAGYTTIFREIDPRPGFESVFVQSGVGSFAASAAWYYNQYHKETRPKLISVEPTDAACLLESIRHRNGQLRAARGGLNSIMAGLNCGTPSLVAWPLIRNRFNLFLSVPDKYAAVAMRQFYYPKGDDPEIISGASGAAGLGGLLALLGEEKLAAAREKLGINSMSRILLFNTEGDTDPVHFGKVINRTA